MNLYESETSLLYKVSFRTAKVAQRDPVSKKLKIKSKVKKQNRTKQNYRASKMDQKAKELAAKPHELSWSLDQYGAVHTQAVSHSYMQDCIIFSMWTGTFDNHFQIHI